jgi:hypothetical protein
MKKENGYYVWSKGEKEKLSNYFSTKEMECSCSLPTCKEQKISIELIEKLNKIRELVKSPIRITSAFRCDGKQQELRGSGIKTAIGKSTHELGHAVDVQLIDKPKEEMFIYLEQEFKAIGIAKTFYHVDLRSDKLRRWVY